MDAFDFDTSPGVPVIAPGLQQIAQQAISVPDHVVPLPMPPAAAPAPPPSRKGKASGSADDKPFVCSHATCDKAFARKSDLIRHNRIVRPSRILRQLTRQHEDERPFPCTHPGCNKSFIQRSALTTHSRTHTGEQQHKCSTCNRAFNDSSSLARHRRVHASESLRGTEMRSKEDKKPWKCTLEECDKAFCRKITLQKHQLRCHPDACSPELSSQIKDKPASAPKRKAPPAPKPTPVSKRPVKRARTSRGALDAGEDYEALDLHDGSPEFDDEDELDEDMYEEEDDDLEDEVSFDSGDDDAEDAGPVASTSQPPTHGLSLRSRRGVPVPSDDAPATAQLAQSIDVVRRYAPQSSNTRGSGVGDDIDTMARDLVGSFGFASDHRGGQGVVAPEFGGSSSGNIDVVPARWNCSFLSSNEAAPSTALIILNEPIQHARLLQLWDKTSLHIFADGGANRVYDVLSPEERIAYQPDLIKGDLDSLRADVRAFYETLGVPVIRDRDQNSTDLGKCIAALPDFERRNGMVTPYRVVLLGGLTGRLDQTAHTLHALHPLLTVRPGIWVVSEYSVACLLNSGENLIDIDHAHLGPTCGLLPLTGATRISTRGLEWDLHETLTSFETMVSTSNHVLGQLVHVTTDKPLVWTCEIKPAPAA